MDPGRRRFLRAIAGGAAAVTFGSVLRVGGARAQVLETAEGLLIQDEVLILNETLRLIHPLRVVFHRVLIQPGPRFRDGVVVDLRSDHLVLNRVTVRDFHLPAGGVVFRVGG